MGESGPGEDVLTFKKLNDLRKTQGRNAKGDVKNKAGIICLEFKEMCNDSCVSYKGVVQFADYVTLEEARNRLVPDGVHITAEHIAGNISRVICEQIRGMDWFDWASLHPSYGSYETKMYNYPVFSPTGTTLENGDKRQGINWEMDFRLAHKRIRRAEVVAENRKSITKLDTKHSTIREDLLRVAKIEETLQARIEETLKARIEET